MSVLPVSAGLWYRDVGQGRPMVFLHGLWMSGRLFEAQVESLSDRYRLVVPDLRGHGYSNQIQEGLTVPTLAADLHELLEKLDLRDALLVGWSMGALVVWDYLMQYGADRVSGIVVVDSGASYFKWPDWELGVVDLDDLRRLHEGIQANLPAFAEGFLPVMFKDEPNRQTRDWIVGEVTRMSPQAASTMLFDELSRDYRQVVGEFHIPTLLCFGADGKLIPLAAGEDLAQRIQGARLEIFENSGHLPFVEEPEHFNARISAFAGSL